MKPGNFAVRSRAVLATETITLQDLTLRLEEVL